MRTRSFKEACSTVTTILPYPSARKEKSRIRGINSSDAAFGYFGDLGLGACLRWFCLPPLPFGAGLFRRCPAASSARLLFPRRPGIVAGYQFYQRNRGGISVPAANFDNPGVAARAILETRRQRIEKLAHDRLVLNDCQDLTSGVQAALFAQRNDTISPSPYFFGFRISGLNPLLTQQTGNEIAH